MGILNVTPDSFYDGGSCFRGASVDLGVVKARVASMVRDGAHMIDIGGESTRPGARPVSECEECDRVLPVLEALNREFELVLSVDTSTPTLMREAVKLGAGMINDVRALTRPGALPAALAAQVPVCLMHMQGDPQTMQANPCYRDTTEEVLEFLARRQAACQEHGIEPGNLIVDPGIGFGKTDAQNLELINRLDEFRRLGPVLLGVSRKSLIGRLLGRPVDERLPASLALALRGVQKGASILRVHDVAATSDALKMWQMTETCTS